MKRKNKMLIMAAVILFCLLIIVALCYMLKKVEPQTAPPLEILEVEQIEQIPQQGEDEAEQQEEGGLPEKSVVALKEAKKQNLDTVAWICVPGTDIDNPVMQTDNNSDYLTLNELGEYDGWGSYFADYYANLTTIDSLIQNTVIYGHAQNPENPDGVKFSQLFRFLELEFVKQNPYLYLTVGEEELIFQVFAVFYTGIDFYYINPYINESGFEVFIDTVNAKNEYVFEDIEVSEQDKLLTLSTCAHKYDTENTRNHRLVVMGKLVEEESESETNVSINLMPERP